MILGRGFRKCIRTSDGTEKNCPPIIPPSLRPSRRLEGPPLPSSGRPVKQHNCTACDAFGDEKDNYLALLPGTDHSVLTNRTTNQNRVDTVASATPLVPTVAQEPSSVYCERVLDVDFVLDTTGILNNRVEVMELHGFQKKTATFFQSSESARVKIPR